MTDFDQPDLARSVEQLSVEQIDALPFGTIRLDTEGRVVLFNEAEARLSGFGARPRIGLDFFTKIAPCMNTDTFRHAADGALKDGTFEAEFTHVGDFDDRDRMLRVKLQSASDKGLWIFLCRES